MRKHQRAEEVAHRERVLVAETCGSLAPIRATASAVMGTDGGSLRVASRSSPRFSEKLSPGNKEGSDRAGHSICSSGPRAHLHLHTRIQYIPFPNIKQTQSQSLSMKQVTRDHQACQGQSWRLKAKRRKKVNNEMQHVVLNRLQLAHQCWCSDFGHMLW